VIEVLEVSTGVAGWGVVRLQGALEWAATRCTTTGLALLRSAVELAGTSAIVDQVLVLVLVSLLAESPDHDTGDGQNDSKPNTHADANDYVLGRSRHARGRRTTCVAQRSCGCECCGASTLNGLTSRVGNRHDSERGGRW
jgi:hypothetical protein